MDLRTYCQNSRCGEALSPVHPAPFNLCPSCWWMAKTSFGLGAAVMTAAGFIAGVVSYWL